jgi:lysine 6-dehydrogenase
VDVATLGAPRERKGAEMGYRYAVLGAGRQGVAAAYDIAKFGEADEVLLADANIAAAEAGAAHINRLIGAEIASSAQVDVSNLDKLAEAVRGATSVLSCVPYKFNLAITEVTINQGANMCDLGGNTAIVRQQLGFDSEARSRGVTVVPDCGMGPGLNISLAVYAMSLLDVAREALIWDGGLPQNPKPPWNFSSTFHIGGLTNEYYGNAYFLRGGRVTEIPCFEGLEELEFAPPIGRLEAAVTSGGLSTAPWTFEGKLERLENKTLRYPGHWEWFKAFSELGLLELDPVKVGDTQVVPRDVLHALLEPKISDPDVRDVCVMRTKSVGVKGGAEVEAVIELIDHYDEETGFTAMQRLTGWHASIVAILAAQGRLDRGAVPVEVAIPGDLIVEEVRRRGFKLTEDVKLL